MTSRKIEIKWAIIFVLSQLLWMFLERIAGLHDKYIDKHESYTLFFGIVAIVLFVFALKDKRNNYYNNRMSYKEGFVSGLILTIFITLLSPLTQWITSTIITPDFFNNIIEHSIKAGYFKNLEEATATFNLKTYIIQSTIGAFIMGIFTTSIVALFIKKK